MRRVLALSLILGSCWAAHASTTTDYTRLSNGTWVRTPTIDTFPRTPQEIMPRPTSVTGVPDGLEVRGQRTIRPKTRTPITIDVDDYIVIDKNSIKKAGKTLARRIPAALIAYDIYDYLQNDQISYDPDTDTLVKSHDTSTLPNTWHAVASRDVASSAAKSCFDANMGTGKVFYSESEFRAQFNTCAPAGGFAGTGSNGFDHYWRAELGTSLDPIRYTKTSSTNARMDVSTYYFNSSGDKIYSTTFFTRITASLSYYCPDGTQTTETGTCAGDPEVLPATDIEIEEALDNEPDTNRPKIWEALDALNEPLSVPGTAVATMTTSVPYYDTPATQTTTTTYDENGAPITRTRTDWQRVTPTSNGNTLSTSNITTTIVNNYYITNENNTVIESGTEEVPQNEPDDPDPDNPRNAGTFRGPGGSAKTYTQSLQDYRDRVAASAIATSINGIAAAIPDGGACPTASFAALGSTFAFDQHCPILDQFYNQIRLMFVLFWGIFSVSLFLRA